MSEGFSSGSCREVVHGDAFGLLADLEVDSAHAAIVDYPWKFSCQNGTGRFEYRNKTAGNPTGDVRDIDDPDSMFKMESHERLGELLVTLHRVVVDGGWVIFMADDAFQDHVRQAVRESDFILRRNWCWTPKNPGLGYYGMVDHYPIPVATNGETDRYVSRSTLYSIPGGRDTEYATGKPVGLYRQLLAPPVLTDGERVVEPFCGSGPGAAVANERDLRYWGCDIDTAAVELARDRFNQATLFQGRHGGDQS